MAERTLTTLTIDILLVGIVVLGLLSSYILIVNNEGRQDIFDDYPDIDNFKLNISSTYTDNSLLETANINSNLSAAYNPEVTQSGADQSGNAISINMQDIISATFTSIGLFGQLLFGNIYTTILSTLVVSILGYVVVSLVIKAIRTGYS